MICFHLETSYQVIIAIMIVRGGKLSKRKECPGIQFLENNKSHRQAHIWAASQNNGRYSQL